MSFLTLNGVTFEVLERGGKESVLRYGSSERSFSGKMLSDIRATIAEYAYTTTPVAAAKALATYFWLLGSGHSWSFDDATTYGYSDGKGLGTTTEEAAVANVATNPKFGSRHMRITADTPADFMEWAANLGSTWTAFVWRDDGAGYDHYLETSSGGYYLNGVATAQEAWFSRESDGDFRLKGDTAGTIDFDDLVLLPYVVPTDWIAGIYARHAAAWSSLPALTAGGDGPLSGYTVEVGDPLEATYQSFYDAEASAWDNAGRVFSFRLAQQ